MSPLYIHRQTCISPQKSFGEAIQLDELQASHDNRMVAIEPAYPGIPPNVMRRMIKTVRMGVGVAMPILSSIKPDGIIIGTGNGGMEESTRFLKQIIDYREEMLAPGSFVQSTANAIAGQLGMITHNQGYNITHVHKGLAFENALLDAMIRLSENPSHTYLLGGVDEISTYQHHLDKNAGWYKKDIVSNSGLYASKTGGSIVGEGAAMFLVNKQPEKALACVKAISTWHGSAKGTCMENIRYFLQENALDSNSIDLLLTGENGDIGQQHFFLSAEELFDGSTGKARFKHMSGEYSVVSSFALWLAIAILNGLPLPEHAIKIRPPRPIKSILIYNEYHGSQHSCIWVARENQQM